MRPLHHGGEACVVEPHDLRRRLDHHAELVVILAPRDARAVGGGPDLHHQDRRLRQRRYLQAGHHQILHDEPLDKWYRMGNVIAIVDAKQEQQLSPQSAYLLASETANAGMVVLSRSQLATPAEMDSTVNYLNHALEQNGCARRFGADVLRKNWEDLTPQDLAAVAACGSKQASYEKMHFDQHDVFSSLYFIDRHLPLPRLKEVVNELFADASCGRIMRIKGFTSDGNGWLELNASRDAMTLKPIAKAQEVIIVIGEQLNRAAIEAHWKEV